MPIPVRPAAGVSTPSIDSSTKAEKPTPTASTARPDPLQVGWARGTTFSRVDQQALNTHVAEALLGGADVPGRVQDGPTCGLYALGMVMDYFDKQDSQNQNPLVQSSDVMRWDSHSLQPDTHRRLFDVAKARGYTTQGEMFYADQLAALARSFGYRATVKDDLTLDDIKDTLSRNHPALIAFDVDFQGNPGLYGGKRAHWAVVEGHFEKEGVDYLVATHGWTGKTYAWRASDFLASIAQLDTSDFPGAPKDIRQTLKGKLVEVFPTER